MRLFAALLCIVCHGRVGRAVAPPEKPKQADDTIDWLFSKSTTAPTSRPASRPTSVPAPPFDAGKSLQDLPYVKSISFDD